MTLIILFFEVIITPMMNPKTMDNSKAAIDILIVKKNPSNSRGKNLMMYSMPEFCKAQLPFNLS